ENGEVPDDVLKQLVKNKDLSKLGVPGFVAGMTLPATASEDLANAQAKVNQTTSAHHPVLTPGEYVQWVQDFEAKYPGADWQKITAAIHGARYHEVGDTTGKFPHTNI